jgi:glycosyltransferase involved in cell wall biosynthesis
MRIGIDASRATRRYRTGPENYSLHLLRALLTHERAKERHEFVLYFNEPPESGLLPEAPHVTCRVLPFPRLWTHVRLGWECAVHPPDVLFVPAHVLPLVHPRRSVVTVHDLAFLRYPETYRRWDLWYLKTMTAYSARRATVLIVDSEQMKADVIEAYGVAAERVVVVYLAPGEEFTPQGAPGERERIAERYGLQEDYLLYVGTIHPKKNLGRLLEAVELLLRNDVPVRLVLAGQRRWLPPAVAERLEQLRGRVTVLGFVPAEDLPALIRGARGLTLPSLFEGFGLPVVEAMACGTPVVAARAGALPEVVGDAGLLVDPHDTGDLARGLAAVWTDEGLRERLRRAGLERAQRFTWRRAAEVTLEALERAATA